MMQKAIAFTKYDGDRLWWRICLPDMMEIMFIQVCDEMFMMEIHPEIRVYYQNMFHELKYIKYKDRIVYEHRSY